MERFIDIKSWFKAVADYFLPGDCYDEMAVKLNFSNRECFSLLLSRVLSVFITAGSSLLLVAQIMKIYSAKSGQGISLLGQLLGLLTTVGTAAYCYEKGFSFGQWGDSLFISIQMAVIVAQILWYSKARAYAFAFFSFLTCAALAIAYHFVPMPILSLVQTCSVPIIVASKGIQIVQNYKQHGTGELSLVTVGLQFVGCIARTFIILRELGTDWLILLPSLVTMLLNGLILAQILYYGYDKNARKRAWRVRKIEKARKKKKKNL